MTRYFEHDGHIYGVLDGQEGIIKEEWVEISEEEVLLAQQPSAEQLRAIEIQQAKDYLDSTDWYVVRFSETGVPVPEEITAKRAAARLVC